MAYVTVMAKCLDELHDQCDRTENVPEQTPGGDTIIGGGICICPCHLPDVKRSWYEEVKASAIAARNR